MAFTDEQKAIIEHGKASGKSIQEVSAALSKYKASIPTSMQQPVPQENAFMRTLRDIPSDIKETGQRIGEAVDEGVERTGEIKQAQRAGEQGVFRSLLQRFGTGAGTAARVFGEAVTGGVKTLATPKLEEATTEKIQQVAEPIINSEAAQKTLELYDNLDEKSQRDVDAVLGTLGLGAEFFGLGATKRVGGVVTQTVKEGVGDLANKVKSLEVKPVELPDLKATGIAADLIDDVIPKREAMRERFIANAFDLSPVTDLANIKKTTGNDVGEFMVRNNLVKNTADDTIRAIEDFHKQNFNTVRDAVGLVDETFTLNDIPEMGTLVDFLINDFSGRKSLEFTEAARRLEAIKSSGEFSLSQAQEVKSMFDRVESIYKATGDVREAVAAQDKANVVTPVRRFIEDRVREELDIDIRPINNNTQTSKAIVDAIYKRAGKSSTKALVSLTDLSALGFGSLISPLGGLAALTGKKVLESAPVQLRMAKMVGGKLDEGTTPEDLVEINNTLREELQKSFTEPEIESPGLLQTIKNKAGELKKQFDETPNKEGGFIKNPLVKDNLTDLLTKKQDELLILQNKRTQLGEKGTTAKEAALKKEIADIKKRLK